LQDAVERGWLRESRSCVSGPVNLLAVLATAAEIASGMALLHSNGIIHGDLSAFNVMLSR
jgi:tRNA A-37 threonylcarbamoyl transferase component Bud32